MSIAKVETKPPRVTLTQNCPASVPQMVLAPLNPGEMILMWFGDGLLDLRYVSDYISSKIKLLIM